MQSAVAARCHGASQDLDCRRGEWHLVSAIALHPLSPKAPQGLFQIDLASEKPSHFVAALPCKHQTPNDRSKVAVWTDAPDRGQFLIPTKHGPLNSSLLRGSSQLQGSTLLSLPAAPIRRTQRGIGEPGLQQWDHGPGLSLPSARRSSPGVREQRGFPSMETKTGLDTAELL